MKPPRPFSALPSVIFHEASPKAISRRTSYILIRLEFLRYPQIIPDYFNRRGFGPPQRFTAASTCSWIGHQVSGLRHATFRPFQTRFRFGSATRRPVLQKVRHHTRVVLCLLVSIRFQVLFHSPPGVLFTFPSRYYSLSVTWSYLALGDGPPVFRQDFSCPDVLRIPPAFEQFRLRACYPVSMCFPTLFGYRSPCFSGSIPRTYCYMRFGLLRFRSPLLSESFLLSFPPGTKMFQFPGFPSYTYGFSV